MEKGFSQASQMSESSPSASSQDASQFQVWFPLLQRHSIPAVTLEPPPQFLEYLKRDGVFLPRMARPDESYGAVDSAQQSGSSASGQETDDVEIPEYYFPTLESQIASVLRHFQGPVFPKLNWSAPTDAAWISPTGTVSCATPSDVFLLLKSSTKIALDVGKNPEKCVLVLKRWMELNPSMEFRCVVKNTYLLGISQRHCDAHHEFLESEMNPIVRRITGFYHSFIRGVYPDESFVFDISLGETREYLVDFSSLTESVDLGLFTWGDARMLQVRNNPSSPFPGQPSRIAEAQGIVYAWDEFDEHWIDYRVVNLSIGVQPKQSSSDGLPQELREASWAELMQRSQHLFQGGDGDDSDTDDGTSSTG